MLRIELRHISFIFIVVCIIWYPFQDVALSGVYKLMPTSDLRFLIILKEALIAASAVLLLLRELSSETLKIRLFEYIGVVWLVLCVIYLGYKGSGSNWLTAFVSFKSAIMPIILVQVGYWLKVTDDEYLLVLKLIIFVSLVSVLFGYVEISRPCKEIWNGILNLAGYLRDVKGIRFGLSWGVPSNFWGYTIRRRMAGTFASPLALGYYLIIPVLILIGKGTQLTRSRKINYVIILILISGLFLTETRTAIVSTFLGILLIQFNPKNLSEFNATRKTIATAFAVLFVMAALFCYRPTRNFVLGTVSLREGRAQAHLQALKQSLANSSNALIIGNGFGSGGGWAAAQGSATLGAVENTYLSLMYQTGGIGLCLFLFWWAVLGLSLKESRWGYRNGRFSSVWKVVAYSQVLFFLSGFVSEQILAFTSSAHFWLLTGMLVGSERSTESVLVSH